MTLQEWTTSTDPREMLEYRVRGAPKINPIVVEISKQFPGLPGADEMPHQDEYMMVEHLNLRMMIAAASPRQRAAFCDIFRCMRRYRRPVISAEWLTDTVLALARGIRESGDFSAMPILADALQDSGCTEEAILTHCRGPGPHVCGCHVLHALIGQA